MAENSTFEKLSEKMLRDLTLSEIHLIQKAAIPIMKLLKRELHFDMNVMTVPLKLAAEGRIKGELPTELGELIVEFAGHVQESMRFYRQQLCKLRKLQKKLAAQAVTKK
jgi:hypothetical protein